MDNNIAVPTAVTTNKTIRPIKKGTLIDWGNIRSRTTYALFRNNNKI